MVAVGDQGQAAGLHEALKHGLGHLLLSLFSLSLLLLSSSFSLLSLLSVSLLLLCSLLFIQTWPRSHGGFQFVYDHGIADR